MITVPSGCGEQNIATTVPNIYVLQYLRAIQASEPKLEKKILQHIKTGQFYYYLMPPFYYALQ
jgi:hypothetical protein